MTRWLLAAEADKIQDFVFRSSRLAQVAGGSSLLSRFCAEVPPLLLARHGGEGQVVFAAGGGFRLTFDDADVARAFGRDLAEAYYRTTDGSLTVSEPFPYEDGDFAKAHELAEADLRAKKQDRRGRCTATAHLPYGAICASCGVSLATEYASRVEGEREMYLCQACQDKGSERRMITDARARAHEQFFSAFFMALRRTSLGGELPERLDRDFFPLGADAVGAHDDRGYVAYLVADGNGTGVFFSRCNEPEKMRRLSAALTNALWNALACATSKLAPRLKEKDMKAGEMPVLPLIVGGDDLFALLPAPYALAFAREFCLAFEGEMRQAALSLGLEVGVDEYPTATAAVVICKQNYPYALAHRQGEALLKRAKEIGRSAHLDRQVNLSSVHFALVRGGDADLPGDARTQGRRHVVPTIAPYWVSAGALNTDAQAYALELGALFEARYALRGLAGKRRAELEELFVDGLPDEKTSARDAVLKRLDGAWQRNKVALMARIGRHAEKRKNLEKVMEDLGQPGGNYTPWRRMDGRDGEPWAHGLPDVLEMWDFAQDFRHSLREYEEEK